MFISSRTCETYRSLHPTAASSPARSSEERGEGEGEGGGGRRACGAAHQTQPASHQPRSEMIRFDGTS